MKAGAAPGPVDAPAESGQAMVEYAIVVAFILGGAVLSAPFLVDLLRALNTFYDSIYYVLQSPVL